MLQTQGLSLRNVGECLPSQPRGGYLVVNAVPIPSVTLKLIHMTKPIILASGSDVRRQLLANAGVSFTVETARVDEESITASLLAEAAKPRDIADTLAEYKARKVAAKHPEALVIGCDQVLAAQDGLLSKPSSRDDAKQQISLLKSQTHRLFSAAVIFEDSKPVWRAVKEAKLTMRDFSDAYLDGYIERNWEQIKYCVGGYQLEAEGARLFTQITGDYFTVLGLPLMDILNYLSMKGVIDG